MVIALVAVTRILRSHLGRAFQALRDSPVACDCMGVSVYRYKVYAFVISAGLAGLAGCLYTYSEEYISPNTYNFELTILFLLAVIMGGRKTRSGPLLGALIVVTLPSLLSDIHLFRGIATGAAILGVVLAGVLLARKQKTARRSMAHETAARRAARNDASGQRPARKAVTSLIGLIGTSTSPEG